MPNWMTATMMHVGEGGAAAAVTPGRKKAGPPPPPAPAPRLTAPIFRWQPPGTPADNTRVALKPPQPVDYRTPEQRKMAEFIRTHPQPQATIRSISPQEMRRNAEYTRQREAQENLNRFCERDPLAAQVNGRYQVGQDWVAAGPTVLEATAMLVPGPKALQVGVAAFNTVKAIDDPSVTNILGAGLSWAGTGTSFRAAGLEREAHALQNTAGTLRQEAGAAQRLTSQAARQVRTGETGTNLRGLSRTTRQLEGQAAQAEARAARSRQVLENFERTRELPMTVTEGAYKLFENQEHRVHQMHEAHGGHYSVGPTVEKLEHMKALGTDLDGLQRWYDEHGWTPR